MTTAHRIETDEHRVAAVDEVMATMTKGYFATPEARAEAIVALFETEGRSARVLVDTLNHAKAELDEHVHDGIGCPCCGQLCKVYRRQINASMARKLIVAFRRFEHGWFSMPELLRGLDIPGRDEGYLRLWALIEEGQGRRADGGHAGMWRVTYEGARFIAGTLEVRQYVEVLNGRVVGEDGPLVTIHHALGKAFDLEELMAS